MPPRTSTQIRTAAVSALTAWADGHIYAENLVAHHAERLALSPSDRGLLNAIVLGTLRNMRLLDHWISQLRDGNLDPQTREFLRIGLCQLFLLDISEHAAVNETVEAAPRKTRGLVNAILRAALRKNIPTLDIATLKRGVFFSHPDWLVQRWTDAFGPESTEQLLEWNNLPAPTYARLNSLVPGGREILESSDITSPVSGAPDFFEISGRIPREWTKTGIIYIQDPATRHCIELMSPQPGETVLDACAAPGGKAALIAAAMQNTGTLICTDSNEKRLPRLQENLENLGITIAETSVHDWTQPAPETLKNRFDSILLDVPCSNTGVLRRRVDARWRLQPKDITAVTQIQKDIILHAIPCLKPGGRIIYSTCSIDAEENSDLIASILTSHPQLTLIQSLQITPHEHNTDGAYVAVLKLS